MVLQGYLRDSPQTFGTIRAWAVEGAGAARAHPLTIRLVKGAYWDHEIVEAQQHSWPAPVFERKADTDRNFEALTRLLVDASRTGRIRLAVASHNLRSVAHAIAYNRLTGGSDADLELQVLRGLGDPLQEALATAGMRVRAYCPVGDLVAGMAYLVRRLLENTSNESFLSEQARGVPLEELLAPPARGVG
jgi:RHH-type proline utilization regulon transcriptional repressor/proline dehydrogenase/delta 1-pyrroline-5-carboxylate dehydrogenase